MCAGRCREPRCIRSPCRGSQRLRRALGGTRILLAAAPQLPRILPLAAVVAVAQGLFTAGLFGGSMLFESTLATLLTRQIKQKLQLPVRILESWVGAGGLREPRCKNTATGLFLRCLLRQRRSCSKSTRPMSLALSQNKTLSALAYAEAFWWARWFVTTEAESSRLQSCPIGHSEHAQISFLQSFGLPVYVTTESAICQPIIWAGRKKRRNKAEITQKPSRSGALYNRPGGGIFSLTKTGQEKITSVFM